MQFKDKVVFITGGAKGIGLETARVFLNEGAQCAIIDIDEKEGVKAQQELGKSCLFIPCDVSVSAQVEKAVEKTVNYFGRLNFLINNAAIISYANAVTCSEEEWDKIMDVNLKSAFLCSKFAVPQMLKAGGGVVINVASAQSFISSSNMVHYTTAKTALLGLTRSIAIDFSPLVRCMAVCPGTVDTPMARNAWAQSENPQQIHQDSIDMHLVKRIATPGEIAELISYLCSDKASFMTGQAIRIDGGLGISVPGSVTR
jgi:NAD(P)-dependent dehydrogenase (short-subunit alcohol dehydrogenase family)